MLKASHYLPALASARLGAGTKQCFMWRRRWHGDQASTASIPIAPDPLVLAQSGITFGPSCFWNMEVT